MMPINIMSNIVKKAPHTGDVLRCLARLVVCLEGELDEKGLSVGEWRQVFIRDHGNHARIGVEEGLWAMMISQVNADIET
jgi:hypothetical protein